MEVKTLQEKDHKRWDEFVNQHSESRFVHLSAYKDVLEKTYSYKGHFLYTQEQGEILSIFPFFEFEGFFKKKFVSQPFDAYGGVLVKENLAENQKDKIFLVWKNYFENWFKKNNSYLEIHGQIDEINLMRKYFGGRQLKYTAILKLSSYQKVYQNFDYQIKKAINKAKRRGVVVYSETNLSTIKNKFYPLYVHFSKKRHGSPSHPLDFFLNCYRYAPKNTKLFFAEIDKKPIAALSGFLVGKRVQANCNPSLEKYFSLRSNDLLHSEFIKWACQNNFEYFDLGPARYEGQIRYKKKWGAKFLDYFYFPDPFSSFKPLTPENTSIKILSWIWKNILPQGLVNKLGPLIRKRMGK